MFIKIPSAFHSFETGAPFQHCQVCNISLLNPKIEYCIHKSISKSEVLLEFAICATCRDKMSGEISKESLMQMGMYIMSNRKLDSTIDSCNFCELEAHKAESYSIGALCHGMEMIHTGYPILICDKCENEMSELISEKTKGFFDDFVGKHLDCPPALAKLIEEKGFVFI